jgi:glycosyltransferase involved in cell wall biosynthesis
VPLVSVILPVHNGERHLRQCLDSILRQTLSDIEVIVVDDGSTDGTAAILAEVAASDSRLTILPGPTVGSAGAARNTGLAHASGEYLSFLDADDFFVPTMLEELYSKAVADNADVAACKFRTYNDVTRETTPADWALRLEHLPHKRPFSPDQVGDHLFFAFNPAAWNKLFRTAFVRARGLEFQPLRRTNDAYFTLMALALAERITYLDRYLANYRTANSESLQGTMDQTPLEFVEALEAMRRTLQAEGRWPGLERAFVNQALILCLTNLKRPKTPKGFLEIYTALRTDVLERFGILGRPREYFLRPSLARDLAQVLERTPEEYLFLRMREAATEAEAAKAEAVRALRESSHNVAAAPGMPAPVAAERQDPAPVEQPSQASPDVSVIIPVYNTLPYLAECLESVQRQSGCSLEIICVDDGSSDGSGEALDLASARDPRIRVVHQPNGGLSAARNAGVAVAAGRFVCFLDSDDYWQVDELSALVRQADESNLDALLFDATSLREDGVSDKVWEEYRAYYERQPFPGVHSGPALLAEMNAAHQYRASACLYLARRTLLTDHALSFYPGIQHEDNLFTLRLMLHATRVSHTPTALYARRVRAGSIVTMGARAAAARGYLRTCVEMFRLLAESRIADPKVSIELGDLAYDTFRAARNNVVELPEDQVAQLAELDASPDAQAFVLLLRRAWREEQERRVLVKRLASASRGRPAWLGHPLLERVKPAVKRLIGRPTHAQGSRKR